MLSCARAAERAGRRGLVAVLSAAVNGAPLSGLAPASAEGLAEELVCQHGAIAAHPRSQGQVCYSFLSGN